MPSLVSLHPPAPNGERIPIYGVRAIIGRGRECEVCVEDKRLSRRHARLVATPGGWIIEDLRSTNGTFVNDVAVVCAPLRDGDVVRIGGLLFKFDATPNRPMRRRSGIWN